MESAVDADITGTTKLFYELKMIQSRQATGKMIIKLHNEAPDSWHVYFHLGRIIWASGGGHPIRRWYRTLKRYGPALLSEEWLQQAAVQSERKGLRTYWEVQLLAQAVKEDAILLNQAKAIIQDYIQEVFFYITELYQPYIEWTNTKELPEQIIWLDVDNVVRRASEMGQQWRLSVAPHLQNLPFNFSPDFAPFIINSAQLHAKVAPTTFQRLTKILNGHNTFWDVSLALQQPLISIFSSLLPLIHGELIGLQEVSDQVLPKAVEVLPNVAQSASANLAKGLIACIDDSPTVGKTLESILKPLGYELFSILDPLQGFSQLFDRRPNLIFLDLVMPNTNGYELCSFLRKSSAFRDIPIVMLTGHDGVIDRLRAKVVGSTEFLSKPPDAAKVIHVVQKFLGEKSVEQNPTSSGATLDCQPKERSPILL
jgi:two-component system, chemotaxis family, response regulator PixG